MSIKCYFLFTRSQWYAIEDGSNQLTLVDSKSATDDDSKFVRSGGYMILLQGQNAFGMLTMAEVYNGTFGIYF